MIELAHNLRLDGLGQQIVALRRFNFQQVVRVVIQASHAETAECVGGHDCARNRLPFLHAHLIIRLGKRHPGAQSPVTIHGGNLAQIAIQQDKFCTSQIVTGIAVRLVTAQGPGEDQRVIFFGLASAAAPGGVLQIHFVGVAHLAADVGIRVQDHCEFHNDVLGVGVIRQYVLQIIKRNREGPVAFVKRVIHVFRQRRAVFRIRSSGQVNTPNHRVREAVGVCIVERVIIGFMLRHIIGNGADQLEGHPLADLRIGHIVKAHAVAAVIVEVLLLVDLLHHSGDVRVLGVDGDVSHDFQHDVAVRIRIVGDIFDQIIARGHLKRLIVPDLPEYYALIHICVDHRQLFRVAGAVGDGAQGIQHVAIHGFPVGAGAILPPHDVGQGAILTHRAGENLVDIVGSAVSGAGDRKCLVRCQGGGDGQGHHHDQGQQGCD